MFLSNCYNALLTSCVVAVQIIAQQVLASLSAKLSADLEKIALQPSTVSGVVLLGLFS